MTLSEKIKNLNEFQKGLGLAFSDMEILALAFVHKSFLNEHPEYEHSNERLEFLGDAVLELVVTDFLYANYPNEPEGQLTNWRSALVKGKNLAEVARKLGLGDVLLLSRGEDLSKGREKEYILANTMEALIGAIHLDKGYDRANEFIMKHIIAHLEEIIKKGLHIDAKSHVQEMAQDELNVTPRYEVISESGPDHNKIFVMGIYFDKHLVGKGEGPSKQTAEQSAAHAALTNQGWI